MEPVDCLLLVSFGGPEGPEDVVPFLENVTRGRGIPPERLKEVGSHYLDVFAGISPINAQNRALLAALREAQDLPVYWGNRNWHPFLAEAREEMVRDGRRHALAIVTSAFPSYSGCRQYREDLAGAFADGPRVTKVRHWWGEEGFLAPMRRNVEHLPGRLVFTAHSVPTSMNATSGPTGGAYERSLREAAARVAGDRDWDLVWQSRSGPPQVPWLEPDVNDHLRTLYAEGVREVTLVPIGFVSDHVEVVYDLDVQARATADEIGMTLHRAATVGTDPEFVRMLVDLTREPLPEPCPVDCCKPPARPAAR